MTREELVVHLGDRMNRAGRRALRRLLAAATEAGDGATVALVREAIGDEAALLTQAPAKAATAAWERQVAACRAEYARRRSLGGYRSERAFENAQARAYLRERAAEARRAGEAVRLEERARREADRAEKKATRERLAAGRRWELAAEKKQKAARLKAAETRRLKAATKPEQGKP